MATSPDLITLTEMASSRFAMVNDTFERSMGWTVAEAVGRTGQELGLWGDEQATQDFLQLMREKGSVSHLPLPFVTKQGERISMLVSAARFVMDRQDYMVINARDVTETERARLEREAILTMPPSASPSRAMAASCWPTRTSKESMAGRPAR
ncbi:MAG: PAS domain-containing protein [Rubrivivax sp.]|nr:PAS domain-containing protein [Rubrivivax sp.]